MNLNRVKGDSSGVIEHALLVAVLALVAVLVVHYKLLWRWDNLLYDGQLSFWSRSVGDDVIIIAIDDESLNDLGRWPWPRSVHARLLSRLEQESPRAIGLDVILSEADSNAPASDVLLARAMQASGKVVLPVFMSRESSNAYPREDLPLPGFAEHAAAMGHVHVDIGNDGIARRVYLKEGIGEPHWMHYALAVLSITEEAVELLPDADRAARQQPYSAMRWHREYPYLVPYAGPPGHFPQIGYSQVLAGEYPKDLFRDKIVLIGATAEGMGDALPTPLSGDGGTMPGVEIVANVIDGIRNDLRIIELGKPWLLALTALLVALPVLVYPYLNPASTLLVLFSIVASTMLLVAVMLWVFGVWIPVSTVLLFQFLSYPLWSCAGSCSPCATSMPSSTSSLPGKRTSAYAGTGTSPTKSGSLRSSFRSRGGCCRMSADVSSSRKVRRPCTSWAGWSRQAGAWTATDTGPLPATTTGPAGWV